MKTREQHLAWCKQRALEYLEPGQHFSIDNAIASMTSDLGKNDETRHHLTMTPVDAPTSRGRTARHRFRDAEVYRRVQLKLQSE